MVASDRKLPPNFLKNVQAICVGPNVRKNMFSFKSWLSHSEAMQLLQDVCLHL